MEIVDRGVVWGKRIVCVQIWKYHWSKNQWYFRDKSETCTGSKKAWSWTLSVAILWRTLRGTKRGLLGLFVLFCSALFLDTSVGRVLLTSHRHLTAVTATVTATVTTVTRAGRPSAPTSAKRHPRGLFLQIAIEVDASALAWPTTASPSPLPAVATTTLSCWHPAVSGYISRGKRAVFPRSFHACRRPPGARRRRRSVAGPWFYRQCQVSDSWNVFCWKHVWCKHTRILLDL